MNYSALIEVSCLLFAFVVLGYLLCKLGLTDEVFTKKVSTFIAKVAQPFLIVYSIVKLDYSAENLRNGLTVFSFAVLAHAFMAFCAGFAFIWLADRNDRKILQFAFIFANCGFVGLPILETLFGDIGLFYGAFYVIVFNLTVWSYGVFLMSRKTGRKMKLHNILINIGSVSSTVGLALYISRLPIPHFVLSLMDSMAGLCTPLSLIITGSLVATIPLRKLFTDPKIFYFCGLKLLALPILTAFLLRIFNLSNLVAGIDLSVFITLMVSLPSAAFTTLFADIYDIKPSYAAQVVSISTMLSPITILIVMKITEYIL